MFLGPTKLSASFFGFVSHRLTYLHFFQGWPKFLPTFVFHCFLGILIDHFFRFGQNFGQLFRFQRISPIVFRAPTTSSQNFTHIWFVSVSKGHLSFVSVSKGHLTILQSSCSPLTMNIVHARVNGALAPIAKRGGLKYFTSWKSSEAFAILPRVEEELQVPSFNC